MGFQGRFVHAMTFADHSSNLFSVDLCVCDGSCWRARMRPRPASTWCSAGRTTTRTTWAGSAGRTASTATLTTRG